MKMQLIGKSGSSGPRVMLFLYGLVFAERDAFGVSNLLSTFIPAFYQISVGILLFLYLTSLARLYARSDEIRSLVKWGGWGANFLIATIFISSFSKSFNVLSAASYALYDGLAIFVIWISIFRDERGGRFLIAYVVVQMVLSVLVLLDPDLYYIDGRYYQNLHGQFTIDPTGQDGFALDKALIGSYGVFHNPNALGFYSGVALALGVYLISTGKRLTFGVGWALVLMGVYGWINSLTRGPMLALLASVVLIYFLDSLRRGALSLVLRVLLGCLVLLTLYAATSEFLDYLIPSSDNVSVFSRFDGYVEGWRAFEDHPILGVDGDAYWTDRAVPHLLPLYMLANHGFAAGVLVILLFFLISLVAIVHSSQMYVRYAGEWPSLKLSIVLLLVCLAVALTNNVTSPFLFWASFAQAVINCTRASDAVRRQRVGWSGR